MGEMVAAGGGASQAPATRSSAMTPQQALLVAGIEAGDSLEVIWERAGYSDLTAARNALGGKAVQAALLAGRRALIAGPLAQAALSAIKSLIEKENTPAATRLAASKWALEQAGHVSQPGDGQDKPIHEMTAGELEAFMARAQAVVDAGGEPPIISVTPDSGA